MDRNLVIGDENGIPWHLPADLQAISPLDARQADRDGSNDLRAHRPAARQTNEHRPEPSCRLSTGRRVGCAVRSTRRFGLAGDVPEIVIIGGGEVYRAALPLVNRLHLTFVEGELRGHRAFPAEIPARPGFEWREIVREAYPADEKNPFAHQYVVVELASAATGPALAIRSLWR